MLLAFYRAVLPGTGPYCLYHGQTKRNEWYDTLDDLVSATEDYASEPDLYYATAAFMAPGSRSSSNASTRRTICFDIDAGEAKFAKHGDKVYPTQRDALHAVVNWCKDRGMLPRFIVSSGQGLHVYFVLDEDLGRDEWLPLANAVKAAAIDDGLRIDPAITGDFVRVLRPPMTLHKSGARVEVLWESPKVYNRQDVADTFGALPVARARERGLNDELLDNAYVGPPRSVVKVIKNCAAMAEVARTRGEVPEPYWRAMLGVVKFTVEGEAAAHMLSNGHPDYNHDDTQAKFDRWSAGPTTCDTFAAENPSACSSCPHRGKIKSPILLGSMTDDEVAVVPAAQAVVEERMQQAETALGLGASYEGEDEQAPPWDGYLPDGVKVDAEFRMGMWREVKTPTPDGKTETTKVFTVFSPVPYWFPQWADAAFSGDEAVMDMFIYKPGEGRVDSYRMPLKAAAKNDTLLTFLAGYSILPMSNETKTMHADYTRMALERIRRAGQRPKIANRLGADYDRQGDLFIAHGPFVCDKAGSVSRGIVSDKLGRSADDYTVDMPPSPTGQWALGEWYPVLLDKARRHVEFLNKHYAHPDQAPYRLAIALAWASPMLAFMEGTFIPRADLTGGGLVVSLHSSTSGRGKSHAQRNAALAFGDPNRLVQQRDEASATVNARMEVVAYAGTLPVFMDEMGEVQPQHVANMVSSIANGATKIRLNKDLSALGGHKIAVVALLSTNRSQRELIAMSGTETNAKQMRLLEIGCDHVPDIEGDGSYERELAELQDCRGAVGMLIHAAMARLGGAGLNRLGQECAEKARKLVDGAQDGRFLWRALGAMLAVRRVLKLCGLELFNGDDLVGEFRKWHDVGYQFTVENTLPQDGGTLLGLMLTELTSKTLFTNAYGAEDGKLNLPLNDRMPDHVVARAIRDDRIVYVSTEAVRDWAFKRKAAYQTIIQMAKESGLLLPVSPDEPGNFTHRINLFYGTKLNQGSRIACLCVRTSALAAELPAPMSNVTPLRKRTAAPVQTPSSAASP